MAGWLDGWIGDSRRLWAPWEWMVAVVVALAATFALILVYPEVQDETWERIQRTGAMRVGMDASFPPFASVDGEGTIVGFDVDLAHELGRRLAVEVQLVNVAFDGLYDGLRAGKYDAIISALPYDPRLTQDVAYSYAYFNAGQALVVRSEETGIRGIRDLAGRTVAVEWGSSGDLEVRKLARRVELSLVLQRTPQEALQSLVAGQADAAIVDAVSALGFIGAGDGVRIVGGRVTDEPYVIAMPLDSPGLLGAVNDALVEMKEDGFIARLWATWF